MNVLRKVLIASVFGVALLCPALTSKAEANGYGHREEHHREQHHRERRPQECREYSVYYRGCVGSWAVYGCYGDYGSALAIAQGLEQQGYDAFVK